MTIATVPRLKFLKEPTSPEWVELALNNLDEILLDHSYCEKKAAGMPLNMMFRYSAATELIKRQS